MNLCQVRNNTFFFKYQLILKVYKNMFLLNDTYILSGFYCFNGFGRI